MEKYIFDQSNGLWYELQGDYYVPRLVLDELGTYYIRVLRTLFIVLSEFQQRAAGCRRKTKIQL